MLLYEKKIGYLSVYQDGERKSSAGFLKIERERSACRLEIHIKKGAEVYNGNYALALITKSRELPWGTVAIRKEKGFTEKNFPIQKDMFCFEGEQVNEDDVCGIIIRLGEGCWISGCWKEARGAPAHDAALPEEGGKDRSTGTERVGDNRRDSRTDDMPTAGGYAEEPPEAADEFAEHESPDYEFGKRPALHAAGGRWFEDKWAQLQKNYKTVHPFGDERAFVTIELRDFHILKAPFQRLANNSFLLHGFYNYRHLILGPDKEMGGSNGLCFYLGVPGVYFEREKMVAVMFGFEGFECSGAVETGKFGYYMRRVEI